MPGRKPLNCPVLLACSTMPASTICLTRGLARLWATRGIPLLVRKRPGSIWRGSSRGDRGVEALGTAARETPPGTDALGRVFAAADAPVLLLFDEVLNFVNRHRAMADGFYAFIQNLTVAVTGRTQAAAVISLPRSQVEMTEWDQEWQDRITKVVRRVARDLIANDEAEISEVVRRRLIEDLGSDRVRKATARRYADWCFERSARLPPEWTAVDSATKERHAKEYLRERFEACYPFHPATLSVFQRKWRALPQFQQTRGALAMLAQWISCASSSQFQEARTEPPHHVGFGAARRAGLPRCRAWAAWRIALGCRHRRRHRRAAGTRPGA